MSGVIQEIDLVLSRAAVERAVKDAGAAGERIAKQLETLPYFKTAGEKMASELKRGLERGSLEDWARDSTAKLKRALEFAMADIRKLTAKGLITSGEAEQQGRLAGLAYNSGLLKVISTAGARGTFRGQGGAELYVQLTSQLQKVRPEALATAVSVNTLGDRLASTSAKASAFRQAMNGTSANVVALGAASSRVKLGLDPIAAGIANTARSTVAWTGATEKASKAAAEKTRSVAPLRNALASLAIQQTGVSGTTGRMVSALLTLGAGSGIVLAIAAGIALIAAAYNKITEGAREAAAEVKEVIERLNEQIRTENRLKAAQKDVVTTDRAAKEIRKDIEEKERKQATAYTSAVRKGLQKEIADLRAELTTALTAEAQAGVNLANAQFDIAVKQAQAISQIEQSGKVLTAAQKRIRDEARALIESQAASPYAGVAFPTDTNAGLARLTRQAEAVDALAALDRPGERASDKAERDAAKAQRAAEAAIKAVAAGLREAEEASERLWKRVDAETQAALKTNEEQLRATLDGRRELIAEHTRELADIAAFGPEDDPKDEKKRLDQVESLKGGIVRAQADVAQYETQLRKMEQTSERAKVAHDRMVAAITKGASQLDDPNPDGTLNRPEFPWERMAREADNLQRMGDTVQDMARGATDVAHSFGLISDSTAEALDKVGAIAQAMPALVNSIKAVSAIGGATSGNILGVAQAGLNVLSMVGGLFGESPEERARKQAVIDNTQALRDVEAGLTRVDLTGQSRETLRAIIRAASSETGGFRQDWIGRDRQGANEDALARAAERYGMTLEEVRRVAEQFGIELDFTRDSIGKFGRVLTGSGSKADRPGVVPGSRTTAGFLDDLETSFDIGDEQNASIRAERRRQAIVNTSGSRFLQGALGGGNLTTAEGRAAVDAAIRQALDDILGSRVTDTQLGGVGRDEAIEYLRNIEAGIDEANQQEADRAAGGGGAYDPDAAQSVAVSNTITRTEALRIDGGIGTLGVIGREHMSVSVAQLDVQRGIYAYLTGGLGLVGGPPAGGFALHIDHISVNGSPADPTTRTDLIMAVREGMGQALADRQRALGNSRM